MDKIKLLKSLKSISKSIYQNIDNYCNILEKSSEVKIDFSGIKNRSIMSSQFDQIIKTSQIDCKFDNLFLNISGIKLSNLLTGVEDNSKIGIHIQPISCVLKKATIHMILVNEFRFYGKGVISKSYLMFADMSGLHVMPMAYKLGEEQCLCYVRNAFNNNQSFALEVREKMPCFNGDLGFALPSCSAKNGSCQKTFENVQQISQLVKNSIAFINLPTNYIARVERRNNSSHYYIIIDNQQVKNLLSGDKTSELKNNSFKDGTKLLEFYRIPKTKLELNSISIKDTLYTII